MKRVTKCLIRPKASCGRTLGATSDICFIAVPSAEEFYPDLQDIMRVLESQGIKGYVAVFDQQPGIEIFCEKICSKIIEAVFCVAVLNDVLEESSGKRFPNANVYFEYGPMIGLGKNVLPVQRRGLLLPFDVNHIEVVKYRHTDLARKLSPLVERAGLSAQRHGSSGRTTRSMRHARPPFAAQLSKALELEGFRQASPANFKLLPTEDLEYVLYYGGSGELVYATAYEATRGIDALLLNTKILLRRLADAYSAILRAIRVFRQKKYTRLLREWEDALLPVGRIRIVAGVAQGDAAEVLAKLSSIVSSGELNFPLPKVEVWDQERMGLEKPGAETAG